MGDARMSVVKNTLASSSYYHPYLPHLVAVELKVRTMKDHVPYSITSILPAFANLHLIRWLVWQKLPVDALQVET